MRPPLRVLVMAKAPVPGLAKTRLAASVGDVAAAEAAASALLDTLAVSTATVGAANCVLALAGELDDGLAAGEIRYALTGWTVLPQRGNDFDERLHLAHADAGPGRLVQIGMDTPQITSQLLRTVGAGLDVFDTVLAPADDGGWWALARHDAGQVTALRGVPMSTPTTHDDTWAALVAAGWSVGAAPSLRDVDTLEDADAVAVAAPATRFAQTWADVRSRVR